MKKKLEEKLETMKPGEKAYVYDISSATRRLPEGMYSAIVYTKKESGEVETDTLYAKKDEIKVLARDLVLYDRKGDIYTRTDTIFSLKFGRS